MNVLTTKGRADRREFWVIATPVLTWNVVLIWGLYTFAPHGIGSIVEALAVLVFLMMIPDWLGIAVAARRLHDLNRSAFWIFGVGMLARIAQALYRAAPAGPGRYAVLVVSVMATGAVIAILGFRKGDATENLYGPVHPAPSVT